MAKAQVFYRIVKASKNHPFPGLYAVEKITIKDGAIVSKDIVKEWDLRILTEAALARFGGSMAYDEYTADNGEPEDATGVEHGKVVTPRTPEELALTKRKLTKELKLGKSE